VALLEEKRWGELWLLIHPTVARAARVRTFFDFTSRYLRECRPRFEGRPGRAN
jgi:hypothetical protein